MCGMDRGDQGGRESGDQAYDEAWGSYWFSLAPTWRTLEGRAYSDFARGARLNFEAGWTKNRCAAWEFRRAGRLG